MQDFKGIYLGFSPTDESDVLMGEIEITISDKTAKLRMATGLKIEEEEISLDDFETMTTEELKAIWKEGPDYSSRTAGFKGLSGHLQFIFFKDPSDEEPGLLIRTGGIGDMLGPTFLFSPAQIARGVFDKAVQAVENGEVGIFPRLRNNGKAELKK